jgi:hypothetical protein
LSTAIGRKARGRGGGIGVEVSWGQLEGSRWEEMTMADALEGTRRLELRDGSGAVLGTLQRALT